IMARRGSGGNKQTMHSKIRTTLTLRALLALLRLTLCALAVAVLLAFSVVGHAAQPFDDQSFKQAQAASKTILVDITASWCPTCRRQRPIVEQIEKETPNLVVYGVRFRQGQGCAEALSRSVPKHADRLQGHQGGWPLDRRHRCHAYPCAGRKGILTMAEFGGLALSYAAGALSTLSPCVLPLLPILLLGALEQHPWGPVALAAGLSASFAGVGIFLVSLGYSLGVDPTAFRLGVAALILIIGIVLLIPALQNRFALAAAPVAVGGQALVDRLRPSRIGGQFALGMLLGAIWSPCSGPTLGAAIGLAAQSETADQAATV